MNLTEGPNAPRLIVARSALVPSEWTVYYSTRKKGPKLVFRVPRRYPHIKARILSINDSDDRIESGIPGSRVS